MPLQTKIVARRLKLSESIRERIQDRADKLDEFHDKIKSCVVTVEGPGAHHRKGTHLVHVAVGVPGNSLVVTHADVSLEIAVREAFDATDRRVEEHGREKKKKKRIRAFPGK